MSLRRTFRFVALLAPLLLFTLVITSPYYSARLSLILHGHPFARVVPKEKLDIFHYVETDGFANHAVVFSSGKAVGMIVQPLGSFAYFEPFSDKPNFEHGTAFQPWFDLPLLIAWSLRWWLLPAQVILLLLWLRMRQRRVKYSRP